MPKKISKTITDKIDELEKVDKLAFKQKKNLAKLYLERAFYNKDSCYMIEALDDFKKARDLNPKLASRIPENLEPLIDARNPDIMPPSLEEKTESSVIHKSMEIGRFNSQVRILNRLMEEQEDNFTALDSLEEIKHIPSLFELTALKLGNSQLNVPIDIKIKVKEALNLHRGEIEEDEEFWSQKSPKPRSGL